MTDIAVLGGGPHGMQIADLLARDGYRVWEHDDQLDCFPSIGDAKHPYVIGAAWPKVRRHIANLRVPSGLQAWNHGIVLWPGAQIGARVSIGAHTHIEYNAVISHGCRVGDFVTVCPGAVLCGEVTVEDDVFIGANATVIHGGIRVGRGAVIGAGAVVLGDVPAGCVVAGVPARILRRAA